MSHQRPLSERQQQRRRRLLVAAIGLAGEGGYDRVLMRDVADRADVALATLYNYFSSKDHLLAESMVEWLDGFRLSLQETPPAGDTTLERVLDVLLRTVDAMGTSPEVTSALISGLVTDGPEVAACQETLHDTFSAILESCFDPAIDAADRRRIVRSLEHVWFSALIGWKNGWMTYDSAGAELADAARIMLAGRP